MSTGTSGLSRRVAGENVWLSRSGYSREAVARLPVHEVLPEVLESEEAVGRAMLGELEAAARAKEGDLVIALLGGRGAQAMHRLLGERAKAGDPDGLIGRLRVFTQDALAPL
ncbi:MAG TPA: hypothetical protein VG778_01495, partial [Blastocatellia bacterium]|nr:hypothetical protein [Blastocatellia bacterium]